MTHTYKRVVHIFVPFLGKAYVIIMHVTLFCWVEKKKAKKKYD